MNVRKFLVLYVVLVVSVSIIFADGSTESSGESITIQFWTAPNQGQFKFWDTIIQQFNAAKVKSNGKIIYVKVQQMPEAPSSEAGIQNALATNSAPTLAENINRGFAATLATSGRVYDIQNTAFYKEIVEARKLDTVMPGWQINGKQYVIPLYANAMGYHWNMVALRELGFMDRVPTTLDDINLLIKNFRELKNTKMKQLGVGFLFMRPQLMRPEWWWDRWFDFEMQYNAFSQGKTIVTSDTLTMDPAIAKKVLEFFGAFGDTLQTAEEWNAFEQNVVPVVFQVTAPWDVPKYEAAGKKYGLDGDYMYGPPIVQKSGDKPYTFADSKGIVFFKGGNITEEEHQAGVVFLSWVFSKENSAKVDLEWLKTTGMLPVRGDMGTNPVFVEYMKDKPVLAAQSKLIPYAIPAMANEKMSDILTALGEFAVTPYIIECKKTGNAVSADTYVTKAVIAMKKAGNFK